MSEGSAVRSRIGSSLLLAFAAAALVGSLTASCRTSAGPDGEDAVSLALDSVPLLVKADSSSVATVWATVLEHGSPVADSTLVYFAASMGAIEPEARTKDGLARVTFRAGKETGIAAIVAQSRAVRDTVVITLY